MNVTRLSRLSNLVTNDLKRKPTIVVDRKQPYRISGTADDVDLTFDTDEWILPEELKNYIIELVNKRNLSIEEMILTIYTKLCEDYTYDDNVLSYVKKNDDDTFYLPDGYGRDTTKEWREARKKHNRRNCFEISRLLTKSLSEIFRLAGLGNRYDVCILWDEAVTHYMAGLASDDYYVSLDLDDFTQIKDITRMKTGLTLEGVKPLEDFDGKFSCVLRDFNAKREKSAKESIAHKMYDTGNISPDDISFISFAIQVLIEDYDLDPAGIYEYIKEIVDTRIGAKARKKVWKEVRMESSSETDREEQDKASKDFNDYKGESKEDGMGKRFTRCLIVYIDDIPYIVDVTKKSQTEIFRRLNPEELTPDKGGFIQFKDMHRDWDEDPYDGR